MHSYQQLSKLLWAGLDLLYPPNCGGCDQEGYRWCPECNNDVSLVQSPICEICGLPRVEAGICINCKISRPSFDKLRSWAVYEGPIREAMHRLKYRQNIGLCESLSEPFAEFSKKLGWDAELVVPVPLGKKRLRERGYNQVALLTMPVARKNNWMYKPGALKRIRETLSQVGLSVNERRENLRNAFYADPFLVRDRRVLVLDDVATTGATLSSCAAALYEGGAREVYAVTLARALPHHGLRIV